MPSVLTELSVYFIFNSVNHAVRAFCLLALSVSVLTASLLKISHLHPYLKCHFSNVVFHKFCERESTWLIHKRHIYTSTVNTYSVHKKSKPIKAEIHPNNRNYMEKTKYGRFRFWNLKIYPYLMVNIFDVFYDTLLQKSRSAWAYEVGGPAYCNYKWLWKNLTKICVNRKNYKEHQLCK